MRGRCHRSLLLIAAAAAVTLSGHARADWLPDWGEKIIEEGVPELGEGIPRYPSRILLDERILRYGDEGRLTVIERRATQILDPRQTSLRVTSGGVDEAASVDRLQVWHRTPDGKTRTTRRVAGGDRDSEVGFMGASRYLAYRAKDLERGSLIFAEIEWSVLPDWMHESVGVYAPVPTDLFAVEVEVPEGWSLIWGWLAGPGEDPVVQGNRHRWEMRSLSPLADMELAGHVTDRYPALTVIPVPPDGKEDGLPPSYESWRDFGDWHHALATEELEATGAVAERLLDGAEPGAGFWSKLETLARRVRDDIRYVTIGRGIELVRPRATLETLDTGYGNCKDKGALLRAGLAELGIKAYPVLTHGSSQKTVPEEVPHGFAAFDHYVLAVSVPENEPVPPRYAPAVIDTAAHGRLVIVDVTDEHLPVGNLSPSFSRRPGLLVVPGESTLLDLPGAAPEDHGVESALEIIVRTGGELQFMRAESWYGALAVPRRSWQDTDPEDFEKVIDRSLYRRWPGARIGEHEVVQVNEDGSFVHRVRWDADGRSGVSGDVRIPLCRRAARLLSRTSLSDREQAVVFWLPQTLAQTTVVEGAPADARLVGQTFAKAGDGWSVEAEVVQSGTTWRARCELKLERVRYEPAAFDELKSLFRAASRTSALRLQYAASAP